MASPRPIQKNVFGNFRPFSIFQASFDIRKLIFRSGASIWAYEIIWKTSFWLFRGHFHFQEFCTPGKNGPRMRSPGGGGGCNSGHLGGLLAYIYIYIYLTSYGSFSYVAVPKSHVPGDGPRENLKNENGHKTAKNWSSGGFNSRKMIAQVWILIFWYRK